MNYSFKQMNKVINSKEKFGEKYIQNYWKNYKKLRENLQNIRN